MQVWRVAHRRDRLKRGGVAVSSETCGAGSSPPCVILAAKCNCTVSCVMMSQGVIKTPSCLRFKDSRSLMGSESYVMVT